MLDNRFIAHCVECGEPYVPHEKWVPVRESVQQEGGTVSYGSILSFKVYPSGCLCGNFYTKDAKERPRYKLNFLPSWRKITSQKR